MRTLLERNIASIKQRLVVLMPPDSRRPATLGQVSEDRQRHRQLVREMQHLRGSVYLRDGALRREQLSSDGLHQTAEDERSWHVLMLDRHRRVKACIWYLEHEQPTSIQNLRMRSCPL